MEKSEKIRLCAWIVLCGFIFSVFLHYIKAFYLGMPYPYSTFLFVPGDVWGDFFGMTAMNRDMDPFHNNYAGFGNNYPPFCYLALMPFTQLGYRAGSIVFAVLFTVCFMFFVIRAARGFRSPKSEDALHVLILCLLTYPFLFTLDRLNAESLMIMLCGFFYLWLAEGRRYPWIAGVAVGLATAMKIYTGVFLLPYISERRHWAMVLAAISAAAVATVAAFFVLDVTPGEVQDAYARSYPKFMEFTYSQESLQHTSSLFAGIRIIQVYLDPSALTDQAYAANTFSFYRYVAVILGLIFSATILFGKLSLWERLTMAVVIVLLLPPVSFDYKLTYIFIPLAAFFDANTSRRFGILFCCLFGALLIPKGWIVLFAHVSIGVLLNIMILSVIAAILIYRALLVRRAASE